MINDDRSRPPESDKNAVQQANKGHVAQKNRDPINVNDDDLHCEALGAHQRKNDLGKILKTILQFLLQELM